MKAVGLGLTLCAFLLADVAAQPNPAAAELKKLSGTWIATVVEVDGRALKDEEKSKVIIKVIVQGEQYSVFFDEKRITSGILKVDPAKDPKHIDAVPMDGPHKGKAQPGIYSVQANEMKAVWAEPDQPRPKEFKTRDGEVMILYRRVK